ncbi:MAG: Crp/Fnr family transcriptional regulator [Cyclobacteriaceae bacterium]|nr:Crp/Fnr family transcriptional regulator [Cyclobacteriaceae bacterium]
MSFLLNPVNKVLLHINSIFKLTEEEFSVLGNKLEPAELDAGDFFLKEGQIADFIAFVEKGSLRLYYDSAEKESCNDFFFENSVVCSLSSFLSRTPSIANIVAIENSLLLKISFQAVEELNNYSPKFKQLANFILTEQLSRSESREASLLKLQPFERFRQLLEIHPKLFKRIPLHYIASYLNISPETLSRYRSKINEERS